MGEKRENLPQVGEMRKEFLEQVSEAALGMDGEV